MRGGATKRTAATAAAVLLAGACAKDVERTFLDGGSTAPLCTTAAADVDGAAAIGCNESCDTPNGIKVGCATRFHYGVNYAWSQFGGDFGGIRAWGVSGVSACSGRVLADLQDMRANGADVVRWWVWPDLRGDGVALGADGTPAGLGGTALADADAALGLAAAAGVHVQLCLFSFDAFKPDRAGSNGTTIHGIRAIVVDAAKRAALMEQAVRPFVRAVTASPHAGRVVSFDIINEPEWAITGSDAYGDDPFTPQTTLETVTHADMEAFVADVLAAIRLESSLPVTVGSAAAKWPRAWSGVGLDFYTIHIYDWINASWPYDRSPADLGLLGKPVVMGEFPLGGLTGVSYAAMLERWYANGYAGAMGWAFHGGSSAALNWPASKANVKAFADAKGCVVAY